MRNKMAKLFMYYSLTGNGKLVAQKLKEKGIDLFEGKNVLIGIYRKNECIFLNENQDKEEKVVIKKDDLLIYFKY